MLLKTEQLIQNKEISGIRIALIIKLVFFLYIFIFQIFSNIVLIKGLIISSFLIPVFPLIFYGFHLLRTKRYITSVGYISVLFDCILIWILPFIWYQSVGGELLPRSYLLKTAIIGIVLLLILINSIALKPIYPLIISIAYIPLHCFLYFYAKTDSRVLFTNSYIEGILGSAIHTGLYFGSIPAILLIGFIMWYITNTTKKLIYKASINEVKNDRLSRYFSPSIAEKITSDENLITSVAEIHHLAILFSDIKSFTTLSEEHPPQDILDFLTSYRDIVTSTIFEYGGSIDKFMGDGCMALFGAPVKRENPSLDAVLSALAMREKLIAFNTKRKAEGLFQVEHRIGIHFGPAVTGNIGQNNTIEYTVVGDTVNIASRLEQFCKQAGKDKIISEEVKLFLPEEIQTLFIGEEYLKGKSKIIRLFSVESLLS